MMFWKLSSLFLDVGIGISFFVLILCVVFMLVVFGSCFNLFGEWC